ncbi:MAG: FkbM family methyltransferase [Planctomycetes bacterium]|nr:FkbM family methyltransferase [Planctomycetota bacterium]
MDIGANVGEYTAELSRLVGPSGRVFALEPFPETFALLADLCRLLPFSNVTALNVAASDATGIVQMSVPGINHFEAAIDKQGVPVYACALDALDFPQSVRLVKVDVEGHEMAALRGMAKLLQRDHPILIVEARRGTAEFLVPFGYRPERLPQSPNILFRPERTDAILAHADYPGAR